MTTLVERLRTEANASEELNPGDSDIPTMREAADTIESLLETLQEFAIYGIPRIDHHPTRIVNALNPEQIASEEWWQNYLLAGNENVKEDARAAVQRYREVG